MPEGPQAQRRPADVIGNAVRSFTELCRRGIAAIVRRGRTDNPWMRYAGVIEGEPEDSVRIDEIVYGRESP